MVAMSIQTLDLSPAAMQRVVHSSAASLMGARDEQFDTFTPGEQHIVREALLPYVTAIAPHVIAEVQRALQEAATDMPVIPDTIESL